MIKRIKNRMAGRFGLMAALAAFPFFAFAQTVQFSSATAMHFGLIEFASPHMGVVTLGTNGGVMLTGMGLFYQGNAVPGQITITGNSGIVEIKCESAASLGGNATLPITDIETVVNTGLAAGSGNACQGIGGGDANALVVDLGSTVNPRLYFGGKLNIPMNGLTASGTYETGAAGGDPLTLSATFQ